MSKGPKAVEEGFLEAFEDLEDPRSRRCEHPLEELLLVALCAVTSGADSWVSVVSWAVLKADWLRKYLPFTNGIASHDTFSRVFGMLEAAKFEACFIRWMQHICPNLKGRTIAIDGKSLRGSHDGEQGMLHLVSAWHCEAGLTLGQVKTEAKSNEIRAIPELLDSLDIQHATVTIDAIGCQREIVDAIVSKKADFLVAVKNNQPSLAQAVESLFVGAEEKVKDGVLMQDVSIDKGHSRLETRRCVVATDLGAIEGQLSGWGPVKSVVMIESAREVVNGRNKGKPTKDWRYYISSLELDAVGFNQKIRAHWGIENSCHWVLDMTFDEDACRVRVGHGAENFAILRRIGLNLIKQEKSSKTSINIKRQKAGWSPDYLAVLLGLVPR